MRLFIVLSTLASVGVVLGEGYESFPGLTNSYNLHTERVTWDTANDVCRLEGGHLLVINSNDEATISNLLFGRMAAFDPPMSWRYDLMHVGITDKAEEGVWRTVLGDLLADTGFNVWRKGEPNNYGNAEHCGAIDRVATFSDLRCKDANHRCPFVCEKEKPVSDTVPESTTDPNPVVADYNIDTKEKL